MPADFDTIVNLAKKRGFVFQSSEIYGGIRSAYDYGPLGAELLRNVKDQWWRSMVQLRDDVVGIDSAVIQSPKVWVASGHLASFSDPLVECRECHNRFRLDKLENPDQCPSCGSKGSFTEPREFNLMFRTHMGPIESEDNAVYLRPETAQGIFINFENVRRTVRKRLPFGIAQVGKSFRNEITPGQFVFRTREFEQMEMEFFCHPDEADKWFQYWIDERRNWYIDLGMTEENLQFREHEQDELSHYSSGTYDVDYRFPWGWDELEGIANRTDFDLKAHAEYSGEDLTYFDPATNERFFPYVIEPAAGATRTTFAFLIDAYQEEEVRGEQRTVLKLDPEVVSGEGRSAAAVEEGRPRCGDGTCGRPASRPLDDRGRHHAVDRAPVPATGRDRYAVCRDSRLRHPRRRPGHDPRPRHHAAGPNPDREPGGVPGGTPAGVVASSK